MEKKIKPPKVANVKCKTEEQCKAISEALKQAYAKGRRFRRVGFEQRKTPEKSD